ncbi:MAG: hypothetical protein ACI86S_001338 [Paracoccaceae bacterium]|jgi:hypothetical protein
MMRVVFMQTKYSWERLAAGLTVQRHSFVERVSADSQPLWNLANKISSYRDLMHPMTPKNLY